MESVVSSAEEIVSASSSGGSWFWMLCGSVISALILALVLARRVSSSTKHILLKRTRPVRRLISSSVKSPHEVTEDQGRYGLEEEEVNANENFSRFDPRIDDRTHSIVSHGTETPSLEHIARPLLPSFEDSETPASYSDTKKNVPRSDFSSSLPVHPPSHSSPYGPQASAYGYAPSPLVWVPVGIPTPSIPVGQPYAQPTLSYPSSYYGYSGPSDLPDSRMYSFEQVYPQNYPEQFAPLDKIPSSAGLDDNSSVNHSEAPNRFPRRRPRRSASVDQKRTRSWGVRSMDSDDDEEDLSSTPTHDSEENQNKTQEKRRLLPSRDVEASTSTSQSFNTNDHMLSTKSSTDTHPDHNEQMPPSTNPRKRSFDDEIGVSSSISRVQNSKSPDRSSDILEEGSMEMDKKRKIVLLAPRHREMRRLRKKLMLNIGKSVVATRDEPRESTVLESPSIDPMSPLVVGSKQAVAPSFRLPTLPSSILSKENQSASRSSTVPKVNFSLVSSSASVSASSSSLPSTKANATSNSDVLSTSESKVDGASPPHTSSSFAPASVPSAPLSNSLSLPVVSEGSSAGTDSSTQEEKSRTDTQEQQKDTTQTNPSKWNSFQTSGSSTTSSGKFGNFSRTGFAEQQSQSSNVVQSQASSIQKHDPTPMSLSNVSGPAFNPSFALSSSSGTVSVPSMKGFSVEKSSTSDAKSFGVQKSVENRFGTSTLSSMASQSSKPASSLPHGSGEQQPPKNPFGRKETATGNQPPNLFDARNETTSSSSGSNPFGKSVESSVQSQDLNSFRKSSTSTAPSKELNSFGQQSSSALSSMKPNAFGQSSSTSSTFSQGASFGVSKSSSDNPFGKTTPQAQGLSQTRNPSGVNTHSSSVFGQNNVSKSLFQQGTSNPVPITNPFGQSSTPTSGSGQSFFSPSQSPFSTPGSQSSNPFTSSARAPGQPISKAKSSQGKRYTQR